MIADVDVPLVAAQVLWDVLLLIVLFAIVPIVVLRAAQLIRASRNIDLLFKTTLTAAAGVVENTKPAGPALDQTIGVATDILGTAGSIDQHSAAIEGLLSRRAAQGGVR